MRKAICCVILILALQQGALAQPSVSAWGAVVMDKASRRVMFEKNAYASHSMASTTKIMTALVALENSSPSDIITVSAAAAAVEGSSIWLEPFEKMSMENMLYGLLLASGNDAASAIAQHIAGSESAFALMMTQKARDIGAFSTSFQNPHGLDAEGHFTTAYDMALITCTALENKTFANIVATKTKTIPWESSQWDRSLTNHNKLLSRYDGCIGVKTGYTKRTGRCLVSAAQRDGRCLIAVTLNAPDDWNDHTKMLDYVFGAYEAVQLCARGEIAAEIDINDCGCALRFEKDYITSLTSEEKSAVTVDCVIEKTSLPIAAGEVCGHADIYLRDDIIGTVNLIADKNVEKPDAFLDVYIRLIKELLVA
ncbi:MAG: D-alanyl-D-alanine carboxypeptidase family protein [Clostridia bacterium]|nr:D-alanyl-D-alanine carboxypeptidase family protein [Clostridia bacterium]